MNKIAKVLNEALDLVARPGVAHPDDGPRFKPLDPRAPRYFEPRPRPNGPARETVPLDPIRRALAGRQTLPGGGDNYIKLRAAFGVTPEIHSAIGARLPKKMVTQVRAELRILRDKFIPAHARLNKAAERKASVDYIAHQTAVAAGTSSASDTCPRTLAWFVADREEQIAIGKLALTSLSREAQKIMRPVIIVAVEQAEELLTEEIEHDRQRLARFGLPFDAPSELHKSLQVALDGLSRLAETPLSSIENMSWSPPSRWTANLFEL